LGSSYVAGGNGSVVLVESSCPCGDNVVHCSIRREAQRQVDIRPIIKAICGGGAEMRRSGDIGVRLGGTHKCRPYLLAFLSVKHPNATGSFRRCGLLQPSNSDLASNDTPVVGHHHHPGITSIFSILMAWVPPRSNNRPVARTYLPAYGSKRRRSSRSGIRAESGVYSSPDFVRIVKGDPARTHWIMHFLLSSSFATEAFLL